MRFAVLGPERAYTLMSLYNLAVCLEKQNKLDDAREYASRALEGGRKVFSSENPHRKLYEQLYQKLTTKK